MAKTSGFTNSQLAHIWAQGNGAIGKTSNGNFYCRNNVIYSYRDSWPLAVILESGRVIRNIQSYSVSTSGHNGDVFKAMSFEQSSTAVRIESVVVVKNIIEYIESGANEWHKSYLMGKLQEYIETEQKAAMQSIAKRKKAGLKISDSAKAAGAAYTVQDVLNALQLTAPDTLQAVIQGAIDYCLAVQAEFGEKAAKDEAKLRERRAAEHEAIEKAIAAERNELKEYYDNALSKWLHNTPMEHIETRAFRMFTIDTIMRLKGEQVETSRGASFPVEHAVKAWPIIKRAHAMQETITFDTRKPSLGHFAIDSIDKGDVKAGCHYVKYSAIEYIAKELGLDT